MAMVAPHTCVNRKSKLGNGEGWRESLGVVITIQGSGLG